MSVATPQFGLDGFADCPVFDKLWEFCQIRSSLHQSFIMPRAFAQRTARSPITYRRSENEHSVAMLRFAG